ncbi:family 78 glycoside hydrolase catalytic domain [Scatolibacter rhodanostii]|uniref:family 78 glycoside hydrolase catalytic domain n=1 Tax=Scatolibacter rhodanostii TaxID=2014781 RepID=UPI000C0702A5|nr:family 78 glycoside hydrolase catalytic domain [Scatolibacter rhodanostii]
MKAILLKIEYLTSPIGIDIKKPRFFWNCENGITQTAYQIIADYGEGKVWDSHKVTSNQMAGITWGGDLLKSKEFVRWRVRLWDENNQVGEWSESYFEMGLLEPSDWQAKWVSGNYSPKKKQRYPVDYFRKTFVCKKPENARLYISACGVYEAQLNGQRIGDFILAPGFTNYYKRLQYQTYDVSSLLHQGENTLTIQLADGWYRGSIGAMGVTGFYGKETKLLFQLETDRNIIAMSDHHLEWCNNGALRFADTQDGEIIDAQMLPDYHSKSKQTNCLVVPSASNNVPVREQERFSPTLLHTPSGKTLLDFGQNLAGYIEFTVTAKAGQQLHLQMAETLKDGELDMANIQCKAGTKNATPLQEIHYTCKDGKNCYKTSFAVFGFRYAQLEADFAISADNFTAIAVYSDMEQTGFFHCSNELINRFFENTLWSMKGNFLDVPTDCPTRERAPWTGDVQIFAKTGSYLMDTTAFLRKWLHDLEDSQGKNGKVPCHAPDVRNNEFVPGIDFIKRMDGCCGWADAAVLVPWRMYELYRDPQLLKGFYSMMKRHIVFQISRTNRTGLFGKPIRGKNKRYISNVGQAFGEWLEPPEVYSQSVINDFLAPHSEEATAYLSYVCGVMMQIAKITGHDDDIPLYKEYHDGCKTAYVNQFTPINTDRQSKLVRPLAFNLLDGQTKEAAHKRLVSSIKARQYKIGTGFLSTPLILPTLTGLGELDIAYKMIENEESPGWLYEVKSGATTVWENWDGSASNNHYSPGSVCEWLIETVCGIHICEENHFMISPNPGGTLSYASFTYQSIYGRISCTWKKENGHITYTIDVPAGTKADLHLPQGHHECITAGHFIRTEDEIC